MSPAPIQKPRSPLISRRGFWGNLVGVPEVVRRGAQQSLSDIASVPEAVLAEMIPVWMGGREPDIRKDGIYCPGKDGQMICVLPLKAHEHDMLMQYNCGRNLKVISQYVARESGLDADAAFEATRSLFTQLCHAGLCHPAAAHITNDGDPS